MTYRLVVEPEAEADLEEAYRWYEDQRLGLGVELIDCVEAVFERLRATPKLHAIVYRTVRQTLVKRFPWFHRGRPAGCRVPAPGRWLGTRASTDLGGWRGRPARIDGPWLHAPGRSRCRAGPAGC